MDIANVKMGTAGSLVVSLVAHGIAMGHEWPFVTVPSFQERASTVMKLSGALYIGVNPVVPGELRETWENYSNHGEAAAWYNEAREYQRKLGIDEFDNRPQVETDDPDLDLSSGVANHIYDYDRETIGAKGYIASIDNEYHPIWQVSLLRFDTHSRILLISCLLACTDQSCYQAGDDQSESCYKFRRFT